MTAKRNWLKNPTPKEAFLVFSVWLLSVVMTLAAASDLFTVNPLENVKIAVGSIHFLSTAITAVAVINFFRNRRRTA